MPYLVAAEIDSIQDYIFRSSRMREIVGASNLIRRFSMEMPKIICNGIGANHTAIVSNGGKIFYEFDDGDKAKVFLSALRDIFSAYYQGSISISDVVSYNTGEFPAKAKEVMKTLETNRMRGMPYGRLAHVPFAAYCTSCGSDSAEKVEGEEALCRTCLIKRAERDSMRDKAKGGIFYTYLQYLSGNYKFPDCISEIEDLGAISSSNAVGYIKADGNSIGTLFASCKDKDTYQKFSNALNDILWKAYAAVSCDISKWINTEKDKYEKLPSLPIIMGGDDNLFIVPADIAIDAGRRFAKYFSGKWNELTDSEINAIVGSGNCPSISVSVVICKTNYPHARANDLAGELIEASKLLHRIAHVRANAANESTINFEVVHDSVGCSVRDDVSDYSDTLRPYFVSDSVSDNAKKYAVPIENLFSAVKIIKDADFPSKRLQELREVFDLASVPETSNRLDVSSFNNSIISILNRLDKNQKDTINKVFTLLGKDSSNYFFSMAEVETGNAMKKSGFIDLIETYDYLERLP